jgi:FG-GAP-like repeat/Abnormal spindle-like microcephaly-assoc'd, ASPM-SPD-2-Hydin
MRFARTSVPGAALLVSAVLDIATSIASAQTYVLGRVFGRAKIDMKRAWPQFSAITVSLLAALLIVFGSFTVFSAQLLAQKPVPFINQPLSPAAVAPGSAGFTLTVNGTGFVSGAVVSWNASPLATTFVSGSQLSATVPASDIAVAGTASVTVLNPGPGAAASNVASFEVTTGTSTVVFNSPTGVPGVVGELFAADFNNDGKLDLVVFQGEGMVSILLGNGDGTFQSPVNYTISFLSSVPNPILSGDFNNDGKLDLVIGNAILLGNGDGTFQPALEVPIYGSIAADFNGDGKLDLAALVSEGNVISVALGNGDGTFQPSINSSTMVPYGATLLSMNTGDFNGDGKLDLATAGGYMDGQDAGTLFIQFGNGDGTFQAGSLVGGYGSSDYVGFFAATWLGIADFNGDAKLDIVTTSCYTRDIIASSYPVFLGNGDGTFPTVAGLNAAGESDTCPSSGSEGGNDVQAGAVIADFNGDGKLDLASVNLEPPLGVGGESAPDDNTLSIFLGDGKGGYASSTLYLTGEAPNGFSYIVGDFNGDGRLDLAVVGLPEIQNSLGVSILLQQAPAIALSSLSLTLSSTSPVQTVSVTNISGAPLDVTGVSISGEFTETNTCGTSLSAGASCTVSVTLTPTAQGELMGSLTISYNGAGSPQTVALTALQSALFIETDNNIMNPASIAFGAQAVGTTSNAQELYLYSTGTTALAITSITASGDFAESNTCGTSVAAGSSCTISVTFTPTAPGMRTGSLMISDNAPGSPQIVSLTGTGTASPAVLFSATNVSFGGQVLGTTSAAHLVTLTNSGNAALNITSVVIQPSAFSQTNNCGSSLAAGASCGITVTFTPSSAVQINGTLAITDNASGSPQRVSLSGTGEDFTIGPYNLAETVNPGATISYDFQVAPLGGFNQSVSFACSGAPQQATCTVNPASVALDGRNYAVITLQVSTAGAESGGAAGGRWPAIARTRPWLMALEAAMLSGSLALFALLGRLPLGPLLRPSLLIRFGCQPQTRQLRLRVLALVGAVLLAVIGWVACGGGALPIFVPPSGGTPAGNYVLTVTATSGNLTHSTTAQLTVR